MTLILDAVSASLGERNIKSWYQVPADHLQAFNRASSKMMFTLDDTLWFAFQERYKLTFQRSLGAQNFIEKDF